MRRFLSLTSEIGSSLVGVLMAAGAMGFLALSLSKMSKDTFSLQKKASIDDERIGLTGFIRKATSCEKTYAALGQVTGACGPSLNQPIALRRDDNSILAASPEAKIGNWAVRAFCTPNGVEVKAAYIGKAALTALANPGVFVKDPITKMPLDFNHEKNNLFTLPLCNEDLGSTLPDLECVSAMRSQGDGISEDPPGTGAVAAFNSTLNGDLLWGLSCTGRYNRTGCFMTTRLTTPQDADLRFVPRSCASDDEEWAADHVLQIVCCRMRN